MIKYSLQLFISEDSCRLAKMSVPLLVSLGTDPPPPPPFPLPATKINEGAELCRIDHSRRETENNACAKFWGDKQRALWYVMVFSGVVNICSSRGAGGGRRHIVQTSQHIWKLPPLSGS